MAFVAFFFLLSLTSFEYKDKINEDIPTSKALPNGMKLVWNDEFNSIDLDTTKWWDKYFSSLDWMNEKAFEAFKNKELPAADYEFTGNSIILRATDNLYPGSNRQISSIQTYNWETGTDLMNNSIGGFFETRIKRDVAPDGDKVNIAFWFDSPGPDLKYYLEDETEAFGVQGIRPRGQVFEIDLCEYITTEIVLHGNVDKEGTFERNIGHYIHKGDFKNKWVTHSMLWSPAGLKFYIDGELIKEWWDPNDIKSPNHAMNMFFGAYGVNGVSMEVDYVRYYNWYLDGENQLPNGGLEYSNEIFPWEGSGTITNKNTKNGNNAIELKPNQFISQYIYLDPNSDYEFSAWLKGEGSVGIKIDNIVPVNGNSENETVADFKSSKKYSQHTINFSTLNEHDGNKRTVKVTLKNDSGTNVILDDLVVSKHRLSM